MFSIHADAGKSTTGGQILLLSGQVDDRTMQKYEKEAKEKSRESWCAFYLICLGINFFLLLEMLQCNCISVVPRYMAYIMDTNEEERVKVLYLILASNFGMEK